MATKKTTATTKAKNKTETTAKPPRKPRAPKAVKIPTTRVGTVALIGRPNVGKSTLLNKIMGQKISIISDKPQTTRISILGIHTTDRGQIIFVDNPGIHKPLHGLNRRMMNFVYTSLETADLICLMIDATEKFGHGDEFVLETMKKATKPIFLLLNKVDIVKKSPLLLTINHYKDILPFKEIIPISAVSGLNVDLLETLIYENLPLAEKIYPDQEVSDQSERFLLAEIIREKVLAHVEKELPWVTAVYIDAFEEREPETDSRWREEEDPETNEGDTETTAEAIEQRPVQRVKKPVPAVAVSPSERHREPVVYIRASIFVERDNHRKIIIGRNGRTIKQIGVEARQEIQKILDTRIYLDLRVKVRTRWRDSADVLDLIEGQKKM
jgi:GTP-binding protein Era